MPQGMSVAADVMSQMRKDAAALPGEFRDLVGIFKTISIPGFQAGASVDEIRAVAAQAMAVSQVMGLPMEQASRELAMLLEGRAGAHNVLGMRLAGLAGQRAEAFNKLTAADRLASGPHGAREVRAGDRGVLALLRRPLLDPGRQRQAVPEPGDDAASSIGSRASSATPTPGSTTTRTR